MKKLMGLVVGAVILGSALAGYCQGTNEAKIGVISLRKVFDNYEKTAQYDKQLNEEAKQVDLKRQQLEKEIEKIKASLEVLGKEEKQKKLQELRAKQLELRKYVVENMRRISQERERYMKEILRDIKPVITDYAKKHGYKIILNGDMLLYVDEAYDLTDQIVSLLNKNYKAE